MGAAVFIGGDWGTSHLRLFLCDAHGLALDTRSGPGAAESGGRFADVLAGLTMAWREQHGELSFVLSGMVGSNIGWRPAPYLRCPASPARIVEGCVALPEARAHIVPGLQCRNRFDAPDFLRGEETQLVGALELEPSLADGAQLVCLPGTHTKWLLLEEGCAREFLSALTGETYATLREHSLLLRGAAPTDRGAESLQDAPGDQLAAFREGLERCRRFPHAALLHRLFECRARRLDGELSVAAAAAYLSALLIGSDVSAAVELFAPAARRVCVVGAPALAERYTMALASSGLSTCAIDGEAAARMGLARVHRELAQRQR